MENNPIWKSNNIKFNDKLTNTNVDILIIGGGITGVTSAYFLSKLNKKVLLIDKDNICNDTTYKSTAKISFIQKDIYQKLESTYNFNTSKLYFESQKSAINTLIDIIDKEKIDCELEKVNSYLFTNDECNIKKLDKEKNLLEKLGVKCFVEDHLPIPYEVKKCFYVEDNYTFNPKKYVENLAKKISNKIDIVINTTAYNIEKKDNLFSISTNKGIIKSKKVIVATHYPFFIFPNIIPIRNYISREYVNTCKYKIDKQFTAINIDKSTESIRFYNDNIIYVSNNHRLTNKINYQKNYEESRNKFKSKFKKNPEYSWMNQDMITNDYLPIIGYSRNNDKNLMIACGYNAWGMTNGVIASLILADLINEKENIYYNLFRPDRISTIGIINSLIDGLSYSKAYIQTIFNTHKCPHMKCGLVFNNEEKTWDCPCHGSRFDINGKLITGPSKENIK